MIVGIVIIAIAIVTIGILMFMLHKREKISQEEMIDMSASEPSNPPVDEVPTESEKEPEKPKEEPKFREGDWIVISSDNEKIVHIVSIEYFPSGQPKYITSEGKWYGNGIKAHLWDIAKDAKDGDVLAVENMIFIYKTVLASHIVSYCKLFNNKFDHFSDARTCCEGNIYVHPATNEQRDILFTKMKEAGYEWNPDTKEIHIMTQEDKTMTQEDKELLLKDLCSRLPYKVMCRYSGEIPMIGEVTNNIGMLSNIHVDKECPFEINGGIYGFADVKPYLRPMSSMTKEERKEFSKLLVKRYCEEDWEGHISTSYCIEIDNVYTDDEDGIKYPSAFSIDAIDWLNTHHFDYRGLIDRGLALEVPKRIYE